MSRPRGHPSPRTPTSQLPAVPAGPAPGVAHDHREFVPGCFRCDLSRDETQTPPHLPAARALTGHVIEPNRIRLPQAMVESLTEFDFDPGHPNSIPDELRERLVRWCADLNAWDQSNPPLS